MEPWLLTSEWLVKFDELWMTPVATRHTVPRVGPKSSGSPSNHRLLNNWLQKTKFGGLMGDTCSNKVPTGGHHHAMPPPDIAPSGVEWADVLKVELTVIEN